MSKLFEMFLEGYLGYPPMLMKARKPTTPWGCIRSRRARDKWNTYKGQDRRLERLVGIKRCSGK